MENKIGVIIGFAVGLLMLGVLLPIGLQNLTDYSGTYTVGTLTSTNTMVGNLVSTIIPVMIVISIILAMVGGSAYLKKKGGNFG